ncbi:MAG: hypothetical protein ACPGXX_22610, partial [Planctomycetaceae bacterium]
INLQESNSLRITGTGVRTLAGDGNISIDVDAGNLTVDAVVTAHGNGNILLNTDAGSATFNQNVSSTAGDLTLNADRVLQNANIATGVAGTVAISTDVADIVMVDGTSTTTDSGNITLTAATDIDLSSVRSSNGNLTLTASNGEITDNTAAEDSNLETTGHTALDAATGLGSADDIDTVINTLQATNRNSGDINLQESNSLRITGTGVRT